MWKVLFLDFWPSACFLFAAPKRFALRLLFSRCSAGNPIAVNVYDCRFQFQLIETRATRANVLSPLQRDLQYSSISSYEPYFWRRFSHVLLCFATFPNIFPWFFSLLAVFDFERFSGCHSLFCLPWKDCHSLQLVILRHKGSYLGWNRFTRCKCPAKQ